MDVDEYTIEHIMPQNPDLSKGWRAELGPDWKTVHERLLHTLGNLTLTGYNSVYSDRAFAEKRDIRGGFRQSPLHLNQGLGTASRWDEAEISRRAERLAALATDVWAEPGLEPEALAAYRPAPPPAKYSIDDHPHLKPGPVRDLFEAFRREVLALDSAVAEEILKLYIAYKAETNFVDVIPQAKRLRLLLNVGLSEVDDPRGMCQDVVGSAHWGNGDVAVDLESGEQVSYVVGLVRQAAEKQLGSGDGM